MDATAGQAVDCESVARVYLSCPARMTKRFARMFATRQKVEKRASASVDPRELAWEVVTAPLVGAQGRMIWALTEEYRDALSGLSVASFGADTATYYLAKATLAELRQHPSAEHAYTDSARAFLEGKVRERPEDELLHGQVAVAYANLGRKEEAVREAWQAVTLLPVRRDAVAAPAALRNLAEVYVRVGEFEAPIDQLGGARSGFVLGPLAGQSPL